MRAAPRWRARRPPLPAAAARGVNHGVFASACSQHEHTCRDKVVDGLRVLNETIGGALARWLGGDRVVLIDPSSLGGNPSCWVPTAGEDHGP